MTKPRISFPRFRDLSANDLTSDLHIHTRRTDGEEHIRTILDAASARGLRRIAFTEHVRCTTDWFPEFVREVRAAAEDYPQLEILVGCEAKALDTGGRLDATDDILALCDIVLGSIHRFPDGHGSSLAFEALGEEQSAQTEYDLAIGLVTNAPIDVLAHPGGMYARRTGRDLPAEMMYHIALESVAHGVAIEVNPRYIRNSGALFDLLEQTNPHVSLGSDMHILAQLGACRELLMTKLTIEP